MRVTKNEPFSLEHTGRERLMRISRGGLTPRVSHESSNFLAHEKLKIAVTVVNRLSHCKTLTRVSSKRATKALGHSAVIKHSHGAPETVGLRY